MLVAAAVCPHPPLLVPELASGAAGELDSLRAACDAAVGQLVACTPDLVVLVGAGRSTGEVAADAVGRLAPYGVDLTVSLSGSSPAVEEQRPRGPAAHDLPLSLTVGAWLLARSSWSGDRRAWAVGTDSSPAGCLDLGRDLAGLAPRTGLLVLGDGTARRTEQAPGHVDARATPYDAALARALRSADAAALASLDPALSSALMVSGRAAFQVLAGAGGTGGTPGRWQAELLADEAPYGVGYLVATWVRRG